MIIMGSTYCGEDCSARDAAIAAATAALEAAQALQAKISQEQQNIARLKGAYNSSMTTVKNAGGTIASASNLATLNKSIDCLQSYSDSLGEAATACANEVTKCQADLAKAQAMTCTPIEC